MGVGAGAPGGQKASVPWKPELFKPPDVGARN